MKVIIETARFLLREFVPEDAPDFFELDSNPEVHRYLGNQPVKDIAESVAMIRAVRQQYETNGIGRLAIIAKASGALVGWSGLKYETVVRADFNYYDLGYRLKEKFWGQGIATETARASLKYGFEQLGLSEICAAADVDNIASNKVLRRVGLQFKETFQFENIPHNWYTIEKADWPPSV